MDSSRKVLAAALAATVGGPAVAHHSYAMFDEARRLTVNGTVAKLEWHNPHVYIWLYVPNPMAPNGYELYAFENASPNVLGRMGWTRAALAAGEPLTITYYPLKDGRAGGHFIAGERPDGTTLLGLGGPGVRERVR